MVSVVREVVMAVIDFFHPVLRVLGTKCCVCPSVWFICETAERISIKFGIICDSRNSAVGIATGYGLDDDGVGFPSPG
jgi:hypothetical protein